MVSGFVTSPCDQLRIFSGEARLMRMLSKSVMLLPRSNGLERYKVSSVSFCHSPANDRRTELWRAIPARRIDSLQNPWLRPDAGAGVGLNRRPRPGPDAPWL